MKKHKAKKNSKKGFSLIELLIVVAIILIIAAIAIPNLLRSRIAANEASAVASTRTLTTAEITYSTTYPADGFANNDALGYGTGATTCPAPPTNQAACLIDNTLQISVDATHLKSGYFFNATPLPAGAGSGSGTAATSFVIGAAPGSVGSTGNRDFCSMLDGVVRAQQDPGAAGAAGTDATDVAGCSPYVPL